MLNSPALITCRVWPATFLSRGTGNHAWTDTVGCCSRSERGWLEMACGSGCTDLRAAVGTWSVFSLGWSRWSV